MSEVDFIHVIFLFLYLFCLAGYLYVIKYRGRITTTEAVKAVFCCWFIFPRDMLFEFFDFCDRRL